MEEVIKIEKKHDKALGLPAGSVRAILATIVILTGCICVIFKLPVPDWFIGFGGTTITFYFLMDRDGKDKKNI